MPLRRITRQTVLRAETPHQAGLMGIDALAGRLEHSAQCSTLDWKKAMPIENCAPIAAARAFKNVWCAALARS